MNLSFFPQVPPYLLSTPLCPPLTPHNVTSLTKIRVEIVRDGVENNRSRVFGVKRLFPRVFLKDTISTLQIHFTTYIFRMKNNDPRTIHKSFTVDDDDNNNSTRKYLTESLDD